MELWIASPPTCRVRTPRDSLTAMDGLPLAILERSTTEGQDADRGREGEQRAGRDRQVIAAERVVGHAGEPGSDQRAEAAAGIEGADDPRYGARPVEVHHDGRQQRDVRAEIGRASCRERA